MRYFFDGFISLIKSKIYVFFVAIVAVISYGFTISHYSIGIDDTAVSLYYEEGLAPYVGRWSLFFLNRVLGIRFSEFLPWSVELISVVILVFSATLWCALWKVLLEAKIKLPDFSYALVSAVFVSCPLIAEIFVFYLHNGICMGYGITALGLYAMLESMGRDTPAKRRKQLVFVSSGLVTFAMGFYESFIVVFIMGAILAVGILKSLYDTRECKYDSSVFRWMLRGMEILFCSMVLRILILKIMETVYGLDCFSIYNVRYRKVFGDIFIIPGELSMILKKLYVKYFVHAITYFPIMILVVAMITIAVVAIYFGIRKKDVIIPVCFVVLFAVPILMAVVEGQDTRYRTAQFVPPVTSFGILLIVAILYSKIISKKIRAAVYFVIGVVIFNQCQNINILFYEDWLKYQDAKTVMEQVAYDLERGYDISKPIIFRGGRKVPYSITKDAYVGYDSSEYRMISALTDFVDVNLKEKFHNGPEGYVSPEMPIASTLAWGVTSFNGTSWQLIEFWKMHGIEGFKCETDLNKIEEAEQILTDENIPGYPKKGYIKEYENYLIVNLGS